MPSSAQTSRSSRVTSWRSQVRIEAPHKPSMQPEDARYRIIRLIEQHPEITQRELAGELGISLGKVNYCLRALIDKGHIKLNKFQRRSDKSHYLYVLTPAGIQHRAAITLQFLRRKIDEYEQLRQEIDALTAELQDPRALQRDERAGVKGETS